MNDLLPIALDTETYGITREQNIPVHFSWSCKDPGIGDGNLSCLTTEGYNKLTQLCDLKNPKVFHNLKFDIMRIENDLGIPIQGELHDTTFLHMLLDEHHLEFHRLKALSRELLGRFRDDAYDMDVAWKRYRTWDRIPRELRERYSGADAIDTLDLFLLLEPRVREEGCYELYRNEVAASLAYRDLELRGVRIDEIALDASVAKISAALIRIEDELAPSIGRINLGSTLQLGPILKMYFPLVELTAGGEISTKKSALLPFLSDPRIQLLMAWKFLSKARSTLAGYKRRIKDGRVHPEYRQTTITGRSAAKDPPTQQIPKQRGRISEVEVGTPELALLCREAFRSVRAVFIPAEGARLISFDESQVEYRCFAHYSGAARICDRLRAGEDFHTLVANAVFGRYDDRLRHITKMLNYGMLYGMGYDKLVAQIAGEANPHEIIRQYMELLPEMKAAQKQIRSIGKARGFVRDMFGRRYRFVKEIGDYILVAWLCQGTAANFKKYALVRWNEILRGRRSGIVLDVHDELVAEMFPEDADLIPALKNAMEDFPQISVPIISEGSAGPNFYAMKDMDVPEMIAYVKGI